MTSMILRLATGSVLALFLAACTGGMGTGGIVATHTDYDTLYTPSLYYYVADGRDVPVIIFGNPTPAPPEIWDTAVTDAMNRSGWVTTGRFTTTPNDTQRGNFQFALIFGATSTMTGNMACRGDVDLAQLGPVSGRTAIVGAFCNDARMVSTSRVTVDAITSPNAPQLQPAINQLLVKLLPRQDPNRPNRFNSPFLTY